MTIIIITIKKNSSRPGTILYIRIKYCKQLKCPSTDTWIKKMYVCTVGYCSANKRNGIASFVETWVDIETVIQSEVSQKEKNEFHLLVYGCGI